MYVYNNELPFYKHFFTKKTIEAFFHHFSVILVNMPKLKVLEIQSSPIRKLLSKGADILHRETGFNILPTSLESASRQNMPILGQKWSIWVKIGLFGSKVVIFGPEIVILGA